MQKPHHLSQHAGIWNLILAHDWQSPDTVKCHYNAVFGVQEIDRVIAVTAL